MILRPGLLVAYDVPGKGKHPAIVLYCDDQSAVVVLCGSTANRGGPGHVVKKGDRSNLSAALTMDTKFHYRDFETVPSTSLSTWSDWEVTAHRVVLRKLRVEYSSRHP